MKNANPNDDPMAQLQQEEPFLRRLASALIRDPHTAEDLVQETMASAVAALGDSAPGPPTGSAPLRLRPWLAKALRRKSVDELRRRAGATALIDVQVPSPDPAAEEIALRLEQQRLLHLALVALPVDERAAVVLRFQDGLSAAAIAAKLGAPLPTIKSRIQRGLARLRAELDRRTGGVEAPSGQAWRSALAVLLRPSDSSLGPLPAAPAPAGTFFLPMGLLAMKPILAAALAAAILAALYLAIRPHPLSGTGALAVQESPSEPMEQLPTPGAEDPPTRSAARTALAPADASSPATSTFTTPTAIFGQVVSSTSGAPIPAQVRLTPSYTGLAGLGNGRFYLTGIVEAHQGETVEFSHPWFLPKSVPLDQLGETRTSSGGMDAGVIELQPRERIVVTVLGAADQPMASAECFVHRPVLVTDNGIVAAPTALDKPRRVGVTDANGRLELPLAMPASLLIKTPDGRLALGALVPQVPETIVRVLGGPRSAAFRATGTGEAIAGRSFPAAWWTGREFVGFYIKTDANGTAALPSGTGAIRFCKSEPRLLLDGCRVRTGSGWREAEKVRPGSFLVELNVGADDLELEVDVARNELPLRLVSEAGGEPIDGHGYFQIQYQRDDGWLGPGARTRTPVVEGTMTMHAWFAKPLKGRRFIAVPGYEVAIIDGQRDLRGAEIALRPGTFRAVRALDSLGRPLTSTFGLVAGNGVSYHGTVALDGTIGPFPWKAGEQWQVYIHASMKASRTVSAEEFLDAPVVTIAEPFAPAEIRVTGVPPDAGPLFARSVSLTVGAERTADEAIFRGLAAGPYVVGSRAWVDQISQRLVTSRSLAGPTPVDPATAAADPLIVDLREGASVTLPWDPDWTSHQPTAGHVSCEGMPVADIIVYPVYGTHGPGYAASGRDRWLRCNEAGFFTTRPGDPRPRAFLFGHMETANGRRRPMVLDSQPAREGGRYRLALTSLELVASNAAEWEAANLELPSLAFVGFKGDPGSLEAPMTLSRMPKSIVWNPKEPLLMSGLPVHADRVEVYYYRRRGAREFPIRPGRHTRLEIEVPLPASPHASPSPAETQPVLGTPR